jgi:hypothetical protein
VIPASATGAISLTLILLTALLAVSLAAILGSRPYAPAHAGHEPLADPARPFSAAEAAAPLPRAVTPVVPLPQRIPGESGRVGPATGELVAVPGVIRQPTVSGGPPWDPAPRPSDDEPDGVLA